MAIEILRFRISVFVNLHNIFICHVKINYSEKFLFSYYVFKMSRFVLVNGLIVSVKLKGGREYFLNIEDRIYPELMKSYLKFQFVFFFIVLAFALSTVSAAGGSAGVEFNSLGSQGIVRSSTGDVYGVTGQHVFKLDSLGNTVWAQSFLQPINPNSSDPNILNCITVNNDRLFVLSMQSPGAGQLGDSYPAIIVLDTSGALINISCREVIVYSVRQRSCFAATNGGAWCVYESSQSSSIVSVFRTDIDGNPDTSHSGFFIQRQSTFLSEILSSAIDSSYIFIANSNDNLNGALLGMFSCTKMSQNGSVLWAYSYYDSTWNGEQSTEHYASDVDDSGNIYLASLYHQYNFSGDIFAPILVKLDINGQLVRTKIWIQPQMYPYKFFKLDYANDSIYTTLGLSTGHSAQGSMVFDTIFHGSCFSPDSDVVIHPIALGIWSGGPFGYDFPVTGASVPISAQFFIPGPGHYPDYCNFLSVEDFDNQLKSENQIMIYPNPASSSVTISSTNALCVFKSFEVYDAQGRLIPVQNSSDSFSVKLNLKNLQAGIYIVRIKSISDSFSKKFIVQ